MASPSLVPEAAPVVAVRAMSKAYGAVQAVDDVAFEVRRGELLALLGPSGCGKTTTLRLLAGFERPDAGEIDLDSAPVAGSGTFVPPEKRRVGVVFQEFALFPHMTVAQNLGYGIMKDRGRRNRRVGEMLDLIGLADAAERYPHELSGGQQQRVAIGRALAPEPALVLLDEPFSNLDAALRTRMRNEVRDILTRANATAVFVTHDQEEALSLADRVAVMDRGRLLQVDLPGEIYARPVDAFVASFVGDADVVPGESDGHQVLTVLGALPVSAGAPSGRVDVVLRPERLRLWLDGSGIGVVRAIEYFGHDQLVEVEIDADSPVRVRARLGSARVFVPGDRVSVAVANDVLTFPARNGRG